MRIGLDGKHGEPGDVIRSQSQNKAVVMTIVAYKFVSVSNQSFSQFSRKHSIRLIKAPNLSSDRAA